ncbi:MAG: hypothetical protein F4147_12305 [Gammaproteobacteria bacterium]|nr:hypothetical protein [Gammaproteobacteria bacterium]
MKTQFTLRLDEADKEHIEQLKGRFDVGTGAAAVLQAVRLFLSVERLRQQRDLENAKLERLYMDLKQAAHALLQSEENASLCRRRLADQLEET